MCQRFGHPPPCAPGLSAKPTIRLYTPHTPYVHTGSTRMEALIAGIGEASLAFSLACRQHHQRATQPRHTKKLQRQMQEVFHCVLEEKACSSSSYFTCLTMPLPQPHTRQDRTTTTRTTHGKRKESSSDSLRFALLLASRPPLCKHHLLPRRACVFKDQGTNATRTATTATRPAAAPGGAAVGGDKHGQCLGRKEKIGVVGYVNLY